jgi:hypothetical protein
VLEREERGNAVVLLRGFMGNCEIDKEMIELENTAKSQLKRVTLNLKAVHPLDGCTHCSVCVCVFIL